MSLHKQKGSTLVEMVIVLVLFLMIIFAVIEFSIAIVRSAQLTEAVRFGARHAIVNDPLTALPSCASLVKSETAECNSGSCPDLIAGMAGIAPLINIQEGMEDFSVNVKYTCPDSTYLDRDDLYLVTVTVSGAKHYLSLPLVLDMAIDLQTFKSTRLSEDLHTGG